MARKHTMNGFFIALPGWTGKPLIHTIHTIHTIRTIRTIRTNDKETYAYRHHRRRPRRSLLRT
jgi:hypothetical protein